MSRIPKKLIERLMTAVDDTTSRKMEEYCPGAFQNLPPEAWPEDGTKERFDLIADVSQAIWIQLRQAMDAYENTPPNRATVKCSLCGKPTRLSLAHMHQGKWIGDDCCWDDANCPSVGATEMKP